MSKVFFDGAISLDGFWAGDNRSPQNPVGDNGRSNHEWMYKQKAFWKYLQREGGTEEGFENEMVQRSIDRTGAFIMGKRMFEEGEVHWPEDLYKFPVFVVTHEKREPWVQNGTTIFYFINDGIHSALEKAREVARGKDIRVQGGANVIQQYLNAGLVDEFIVHTAPNVLGSGIRLFDNLNRKMFKVDIADVQHSDLATHTTYRVTNKRPIGE